MNKPNIKILIIDDNPADSNLLRRYFSKIENWDFDIFVAANSEDGLKYYNLEKPDIIIIDYLLGNDNGIEIIKKYKEIGCRAEYILLTGYGNESVVTDALRVGASDYLSKSALNSQLLEKTIRHLYQRIESENKIKKTESKLSYILEKTNTGLLIMDTKGIILDANEPFLSMIGISSLDDIMGRTVLDWTSHKSEQEIISAIEKCVIEGSITGFEITFEKPNGNSSYILINALLEKENNNDNDKIFAICRDITERKIYEKQLKAAKTKAEEADKLKSAFLANMSHEIRTPMNAIVGFADLLGRTSITDDEKKTYVKIIKSSSDSLLGLINDIIDLSKIEVEKINVNKADFNINTVLKELFATYTNKLSKGVNLVYDNNSDTIPTNIFTDPLRFKQVFTNLLDNAIKFTDEGTINYGFKRKDNAKLLFYVKDTGIGIPKSKIDIIFDRFRKLEEDTSKLYRGTGLGLTISKKLIQLLGGDMWVESEQGKGSMFYFTLPHTKNVIISEQENLKEKPFRTEDIDWQDKTVLIVEDEDLNYLFLEKLLTPSKIEIIRAKTGLEAIELFEKNTTIDLILMDIKLPEMDGVSATKEIKQRKPNVPIIAQTALAMKGDEEEFINAGCDDYIAKPLKAKDLIQKLSFYLTDI